MISLATGPIVGSLERQNDDVGYVPPFEPVDLLDSSCIQFPVWKVSNLTMESAVKPDLGQ